MPVRARIPDTVESAMPSVSAISAAVKRSARMLEETPAIAGSSFATAIVLGDADRVRTELQRDPTLATRPDPRTGCAAPSASFRSPSTRG